MTFEQRKIALINWITELDNEELIRYMEQLQNQSIHDFPDEIVELLNLSNLASKADCTEHSNSRTILGRK
tara:strand:- start:1612 stop:1821 length:210 start_codon:yes stop_codon:yes gene_type:complete